MIRNDVNKQLYNPLMKFIIYLSAMNYPDSWTMYFDILG